MLPPKPAIGASEGIPTFFVSVEIDRSNDTRFAPRKQESKGYCEGEEKPSQLCMPRAEGKARGRVLEQAIFPRQGTSLGAVLGSQLEQDVGHMFFRRGERDDQLVSNLLVGGPLCQ
jgi:hypothetical protein